MKPYKITIFLCCLIVFFSTTTFGQKNQKDKLHIFTEEKILGKNFINESEIKGTELIFSDEVYKVYYDAESNVATIQTKGKKNIGNIFQYDLMNNKVLWTKPIYHDDEVLLKFEKLLIHNGRFESYSLDTYTGENLWNIKNYISIAYPEYNIGIAYMSSGSSNVNDFIGIDLIKKKLIWKRNINKQYGWNDYFHLNDSTLMVVASGLHTMNIKTGEGWDYNAVSGDGKESEPYIGVVGIFGGMFFGLIGGLIGGLIDGIISTAIDGGGIIRDLVSNTLMDNMFIYFASKDELVKIDMETGNIIWKTEFPKEMTSKSYIFMDDNFVYMVNYGYAIQNNRRITYGKPFVAAFDKLTGKEKYLTLTNKANGPILDYKLNGNKMYLLFSNDIAKYRLETGNLIYEKIFPQIDVERFTNFADNKIFIFTKESSSDIQYFFNLAQLAPTDLYVYTTQGKIISVDNELNTINIIENGNFGVSYLGFNNYEFIAKNKKTYIIDSLGRIIAELDVSSNAFIMNDIIYYTREKSLIAVDLRNL